MSPRLLSLLTLVEVALSARGAPAVSKPTTRTVSFHKGLARLSFSDASGSILLQSFTLADGQICLKLLLSWSGTASTVPYALYPQGEFDWAGEADKIADLWMVGPPKDVDVEGDDSARQSMEEEQPASGQYAATG